MARRKNRLVNARELNGRIQRVSVPSNGEVRRLREAALSGMRDPFWGTELGRLHLAGKIDASMFAAGKRWSELSAKYSQALSSPSPDPKAVNWQSLGGEPCDCDSHEGRKEARRHVRAVQSFIDAHVALKTTVGASERILRHVCERNEMIAGHYELLSLICGLKGLSDFWGLTDRRKSDVR